jgi:hypothetical protein
MSIKQYKIRDINKDDKLHNEVFVKVSDMIQLFENLTQMAIDAGADPDKMMSDNEKQNH